MGPDRCGSVRLSRFLTNRRPSTVTSVLVLTLLSPSAHSPNIDPNSPVLRETAGVQILPAGLTGTSTHREDLFTRFLDKHQG